MISDRDKIENFIYLYISIMTTEQYEQKINQLEVERDNWKKRFEDARELLDDISK